MLTPCSSRAVHFAGSSISCVGVSAVAGDCVSDRRGVDAGFSSCLGSPWLTLGSGTFALRCAIGAVAERAVRIRSFASTVFYLLHSFDSPVLRAPPGELGIAILDVQHLVGALRAEASFLHAHNV